MPLLYKQSTVVMGLAGVECDVYMLFKQTYPFGVGYITALVMGLPKLIIFRLKTEN